MANLHQNPILSNAAFLGRRQTHDARPRSISAETIESIRSATRLENIVGERIPLRRSGKVLVGSCPWHKSRSGRSFVVYPERQTWRCWGCNVSGDVFSFFERFAETSFPAAVKLVAKVAGINLDVPVSDEDRDRIRWHAGLSDVERRIDEILDAEFMHALREYDSARALWQKVRHRLNEINSGAPERFRDEEQLAWLALAASISALRRIDVEYMLLGFADRVDREKFCAADPEKRKRIVDALLDDGCMIDEHRHYFEVPEW